MMQQIWKILRAVFKKRPKIPTKNGHLISYNQILSFFSKKHQAQTMRPIVPYDHAKIWEYALEPSRRKNLKNGHLIQDDPVL